jgi:hypothetical protein
MATVRGSFVLSLIFFLATTARAQISCTTPDDLCTGDPCVIHDVQVLTPCNVDFGTRTVEINGRLRVRDSGSVSLSAGAFRMRGGGSLNGSHTEPGGHGSNVTLLASGNIEIDGRVLMSGAAGGGSLLLIAGGTVTVAGNVRLLSEQTGSGGMVSIHGDAGVDIERFLDVRGPAGGVIDLSSSSGDVTVDEQVRAGGSGVIVGGSVSLSAGGNILLNGRILTTAHEMGGPIMISTTSAPSAGNVVVNTTLKTRGQNVFGGSVRIALAPTGVLSGKFIIDVTSRQTAGTMCVEGGSVDASATVKANGTLGPGGQIRIQTAGDLTLHGKVNASRGGVIEVQAAGNLTTDGKFDVRGGCIAASCGGTCSTAGASFDVSPVSDCPGDCP